jgi:hypothetical protein
VGFRHLHGVVMSQRARSAIGTLNVYASKRRAEAAPGVGHYTDIAVIRDRGITYLTHEQLARVGELYADMYRPITDTLRKRLVGMQLLESGTSDLAQIE